MIDAERNKRFPLGSCASLCEKVRGKQSLVFEVDGTFLYDEESGRVIFDVLDRRGQDGQIVDVGGEGA